MKEDYKPMNPYSEFFRKFMSGKTEEEKIKVLTTLGALTFIVARSFNLYNRMFQAAAKQLRMEHTQERKMYLKMIEDGCDKCRIGLTNFEDWALDATAGEEEDGLNYYLQDGAWVAKLAALTFNASDYSPNVRLFIESYCMAQTKGEAKIPYEIIQALNPDINTD